MGKLQYTNTFLTYVVTADQTATGFPADRLKLFQPHALDRHWRSTSTATQTIVYDLGGDVALAGCMFGGMNFVTLAAEYKTAAGIYTAFTGSPFTVAKWGDYYRHMIVQSVTARYIKETITSQATVATGGSIAGVSYYKQGLFWPVVSTAWVTLSHSPLIAMREAEEAEYLREGKRAVPVSPKGRSWEWRWRVPKTQIGEIELMASNGQNTDLLVYENLGDPSAVYVVRFTSNLVKERHHKTGYVDASISVQEQV